ncbi:hypothetical protein [Rhizomonospora bruguierae]|uniref:hypothetical protein n=1 Tax=Rhizomonospora bruguierae TaxID=1581705 RepID=UPI001BD1BC62|nr:hypothetical protein [Micromonospora sp. NBRC 107566]
MTDVDEPPAEPPAPAKVVISTPGVSVCVEAPEPAATVLALAQHAHQEAQRRANQTVIGGYL